MLPIISMKKIASMIFQNVPMFYLKRIKYCNEEHFKRTDLDLSDWENFLNSINYLLELVLDY